MLDNEITRFPNGLTNNLDNHFLSNMGFLDPTKYMVYMEDFIDYLGPKGSAWTAGVAVNNWIPTEVGNANISYGPNYQGTLTLLTGTTSGNNLFLIRDPINMVGPFEGTPFWFKTAVTNANTGDRDFIIGLADQANFTPTDGIYFLREGDTDLWSLVVREDGAEVISAMIDPGSNSQFRFGFAWDGIDTIVVSLDDEVIESIPLAPSQIPDPLLVPMMGLQTNQGSAAIMDVDYIFVASERRIFS